MATLVGTQKEIAKLVHSLIELDLDAIEAYRAAIKRLDDAGDRTEFARFMSDHDRHVLELGRYLESRGEPPPRNPDVKAILTKGKVVIGGLVGDRAILLAMKTNEDDTNTAYARASARNDLPIELRPIIENALADERRHRDYIQRRVSESKPVAAHR